LTFIYLHLQGNPGRGGSPGRGRQMTVGLSTTALFGDLCGYFFGNVRDKTSNITWRYATLVCL